MPTYVYRCAKCGDEIEVIQKMADPPLKRCKKCRGALQRVYQPAGIVLKGPGFHRTDYRSSRSKASEKADSAPKSDSKSESKSESKPDSKPAETKKADSAKSKSASSTGSSD